MSDKRLRRRAKQARRDARRLAAYKRKPSDEDLVSHIRGALAKGHPLGLLAVVSYLIFRSQPDPLAKLSAPPEPLDLDVFIANLVTENCRETTAMLAVLAELLVNEQDRQARCRAEVSKRKHALPKWISALPDIDARRVVRATHVLGDTDELIIGAQLAGRYDMTCTVRFDHNTFFEIDGVDITSGSMDGLLSGAVENNPDFTFTDMSAADAGAWLRHGLDQPMFPRASDRFQEVLPLVRWLSAHLPDGGAEYQRPEWDWSQLSELFGTFFATPAGAPFNDYECRWLLEELVESGTGDPLRWSVTRIEQVLGPWSYTHNFDMESTLAVPDLLRAFVPFAHAQSGVRDELTAEVIAAIDRKARGFRREVLRDAI